MGKYEFMDNIPFHISSKKTSHNIYRWSLIMQHKSRHVPIWSPAGLPFSKGVSYQRGPR